MSQTTQAAHTTPLVDVPNPTPQQVFDAVVTYSRTMTEKSAVPRPGVTTDYCLYRGPNGNACFVGCLLTDEEARGLDDDVTAGTGAGSIPLPARLVPHRSLLARLQGVHDTSAMMDWPAHLAIVARERGLTIPS